MKLAYSALLDYLFIYLSISVSPHLCIHVSPYLSICLYPSIHTYLSIYLSICFCKLAFILSVFVGPYRSTYIVPYLLMLDSIYLSIYLSIYVSPYLSIYLSIYQFLSIHIDLSITAIAVENGISSPSSNLEKNCLHFIS